MGARVGAASNQNRDQARTANGRAEGGESRNRAIVAYRTKIEGRRVVVVGDGHATSILSRVTAAERAVAELAAHGRSNRSIAERRGSSAKTVANQLLSVYRKLGIASREELVTRITGTGLT